MSEELMGSEPLNQLTFGSGSPETAQVNVKDSPSLMVRSLRGEVNLGFAASSGTENSVSTLKPDQRRGHFST